MTPQTINWLACVILATACVDVPSDPVDSGSDGDGAFEQPLTEGLYLITAFERLNSTCGSQSLGYATEAFLLEYGSDSNLQMGFMDMNSLYPVSQVGPQTCVFTSDLTLSCPAFDVDTPGNWTLGFGEAALEVLADNRVRMTRVFELSCAEGTSDCGLDPDPCSETWDATYENP